MIGPLKVDLYFDLFFFPGNAPVQRTRLQKLFGIYNVIGKETWLSGEGWRG